MNLVLDQFVLFEGQQLLIIADGLCDVIFVLFSIVSGFGVIYVQGRGYKYSTCDCVRNCPNLV